MRWRIRTAGAIPNIVANAEDMLGEADGVAVVWRHGSKHLEAALPFIKAGLPVYIYKPFTASVADARALVAAAQKAKIPFSSFSNLRYSDGTRNFIAGIPDAMGASTFGISTGAADPASEYDGIFFYGIHSVELVNAIWGYGCKVVTATPHQGGITATCEFENGTVVLVNFMTNIQGGIHHVTAYGTKSPGYLGATAIDDTAYYNAMSIFIDMMRTGKWPLTPEQLIEPVAITAAVNKSLEAKRPVRLEESG